MFSGGGQTSLSSLTELWSGNKMSPILLPDGGRRCHTVTEEGGKSAFTLAEVLITLGIIGVVAAMTLPALVQNYQKRVTAVRLKDVYSLLQQAIRMSEAENGEMSEWNWEDLLAQAGGAGDTSLTKRIVQEYIEPYIKTVHKDTFASSSAPYEYNYYALDGSLISSNSHTHYSLALNNGVYLHFNANYGANSAIAIRVDINGRQKPNTIGIDTFFLQFYPKLKFYDEGANRDRLLELCSKGSDSNSQRACGALIQSDGWEIKNDYPWK